MTLTPGATGTRCTAVVTAEHDAQLVLVLSTLATHVPDDVVLADVAGAEAEAALAMALEEELRDTRREVDGLVGGAEATGAGMATGSNVIPTGMRQRLAQRQARTDALAARFWRLA